MSVLLVLTCVPPMLLVQTLREGTTAHVILGTMEMDFLVQVCFFLLLCFLLLFLNYFTLDVDECSEGTHTCSGDATCMDTDGSFTCSCHPGFTGNGLNCTGQLRNEIVAVVVQLSFSRCISTVDI